MLTYSNESLSLHTVCIRSLTYLPIVFVLAVVRLALFSDMVILPVSPVFIQAVLSQKLEVSKLKLMINLQSKVSKSFEYETSLGPSY